MIYYLYMGDIRVLKEQLEIGMPFEAACILAGYDFEEIEELRESPEVDKIIKICEAHLMSQHLSNIKDCSQDRPRLSTWILERKFPENFAQTNKVIDPREFPKEIILKGVGPDDDG